MRDIASDLYESREKDCQHRVCTSYEDLLRWGKKALGKNSQGQKTDAATPISNSTTLEHDHRLHMRNDCPMDKDELGRSSWNLLHTMTVYFPEKPTENEKRNVDDFITSFSKTYPCEYCAKDFREDIRRHPLRVESRDQFVQWMCEAHNRVNEKLNKPLFNCSEVLHRWLDGWPDGSCNPPR